MVPGYLAHAEVVQRKGWQRKGKTKDEGRIRGQRPFLYSNLRLGWTVASVTRPYYTNSSPRVNMSPKSVPAQVIYWSELILHA